MVDTTLTRRIRTLAQKENVPAVSIALIENSDISTYTYGVTNSATKQAINAETVFQCASITKPMFAYIVLQLAQKNIIDLDKSLNDYLPEPYIDNEPQLPAITARHVLSHTTGFPNWRGDKPLQIHFKTGERWSYSGEGFVYLQKVVEHITDSSFNELADEYLIEPLGMTRTHMMWVTDDFSDNAAAPHDENGDVAEQDYNTEANAAASAYASPTDIARFITHLFDETPVSERMLTKQIHINTLFAWHEDWPDGDYKLVDDVAWGLGWGLQYKDDDKYLWHWGDNGTYQCFAIANPETQSGLVVMTNGRNGRSVYMPIVEHVLGGKQPALQWLRQSYG